jgi:hypothetical protein
MAYANKILSNPSNLSMIRQMIPYHENGSRTQRLQTCSIDHKWLIEYIGLQQFSGRGLYITKILVEEGNKSHVKLFGREINKQSNNSLASAK